MDDSSERWDTLPGALMPFDWPAFIDKHKVIYRDHGGISATLGPMAFRLALYAMGQSGWAFDELLYPDWRQSKMKGPIFILGHQRSGTTFLHRLLASDTRNIRSLMFHEMLLPSSSIQKGFEVLGRADARLGGRLARWFNGVQERKFGPMDHIHRLRFDEIEEDEFVLWAIYSSAMCVNDSPISTADRNLEQLRHFDQWPVERQRKTLEWYRACLLKKVHREQGVHGAPWVLSKNPAFSQKIPALLRVFPDAKVINLVRNPLDTVPSRLSMITEIWRNRFPGFEKMTADQVRTIFEDSRRIYLHAERDMRQVPKSQRLTVLFDELMRNPANVIGGIYDKFEIGRPGGELPDKLMGISNRKPKRTGIHDYSLEQFGLDEEYLREELATIFKSYNF